MSHYITERYKENGQNILHNLLGKVNIKSTSQEKASMTKNQVMVLLKMEHLIMFTMI